MFTTASTRAGWEILTGLEAPSLVVSRAIRLLFNWQTARVPFINFSTSAAYTGFRTSVNSV